VIFDLIRSVLNDMYYNIRAYVSTMTIMDAADILLVTVLVYFGIRLLRKSNAFGVLKGFLVLILLLWVSELLRLNVLTFLLNSALQVGLLAVIIIFQPELRKMLGQMGAGALSSLVGRTEAYDTEKEISQAVEACRAMSWSRQGALIVFERRVILTDVVKTGTMINAAVTTELLKNIFFPKAPLHDGAIIIKGGKIICAGCMLPLSSDNKLSRDLGMRHRAAIGMSENSDAVVVVVSEETGSISVVTNGMLKRHLTPEALEKLLRIELAPAIEKEAPEGFAGFFHRLKRRGKAE